MTDVLRGKIATSKVRLIYSEMKMPGARYGRNI